MPLFKNKKLGRPPVDRETLKSYSITLLPSIVHEIDQIAAAIPYMTRSRVVTQLLIIGLVDYENSMAMAGCKSCGGVESTMSEKSMLEARRLALDLD